MPPFYFSGVDSTQARTVFTMYSPLHLGDASCVRAVCLVSVMSQRDRTSRCFIDSLSCDGGMTASLLFCPLLCVCLPFFSARGPCFLLPLLCAPLPPTPTRFHVPINLLLPIATPPFLRRRLDPFVQWSISDGRMQRAYYAIYSSHSRDRRGSRVRSVR